MRAVKDTMTIAYTPTPKLDPGEALVKVYSAGVTLEDVELAQKVGMCRVGNQFSGRIVEIKTAQKDDTFAVGDAVFGLAIRGGAFSEFVVCELDTLCKLPAGITFSEAALLPDAWFSALQIFKNEAEVLKRHRICVFDAMSSRGQTIVILAQILGCRRVHAVVNSPMALEAVRKSLTLKDALSDEVIPIDSRQPVLPQIALYDPKGLEAVIDMRAAPSIKPELLRPDGRLVLTSVPERAPTVDTWTSIVYKRLRIHGSVIRGRAPKQYREHRDFFVEHIVPKIKNRRLKIEVAKVFNWHEIAEAFTFVKENKEIFGGVVCNVVENPQT